MSTAPRHVAIIMDGNGRWATAQGLTRAEGHKQGAKAARNVVEAARDAGVEYITLFSFSSENWNRPADEINDLMGLLRYHLQKETAELHKTGARIVVIGDRTRLPNDITKLIKNAEDVTKDNSGITVVIALSYGGRQDIVFAAKELALAVQRDDVKPQDIDEEFFSSCLMTKNIPDPDLVIRTGREKRISNFLMWQMAYAEIYFSDVLWPDFSKDNFSDALSFYEGRERRYGRVLEEAV